MAKCIIEIADDPESKIPNQVTLNVLFNPEPKEGAVFKEGGCSKDGNHLTAAQAMGKTIQNALMEIIKKHEKWP